MVLIVGLGNPGVKYQYTRHNIGFMAVDAVLKKLGKAGESVWVEEKRWGCMLSRVEERESERVKDRGIILIKPQTFMNASGISVAKVLNFYKINPLGLFVIHDEIDLPLGKVKVVINRGAAGHHGVESIIKEVGTTNFVRIRVGIGLEGERGVKREVGSGSGGESDDGGGMPLRFIKKLWNKTKPREVEDFVLRPFGRNEEGKLNESIKRVVDIMECVLKEGVERGMGKYN